MEENRNNYANRDNNDGVYEVSILDLIVILVEQRWFIAKITAAFAIIAIIYSLLATPIYKSSIQIMPPNAGAQSGAAAMLAATGLGDLAGGLGATPADTIVGITKSTAVLDRIIDRYDLRTRQPEGHSITGFIKKMFLSAGKTEPQLRTMVRAALSDSIQSAADKKSSIITVSVKDTSPDMAMKLANAVFDETQAVMQNIAVTPSAQQRVFLEAQIKENNKELTKAENNLIAFQRKTGMIGGAGGAPSDISALGALQARMVAKEIEIKSARRFATGANPQVKKLQAEYDAIKRQFEENKASIGTTPLSGVGLKNLPGASVEYANLFREYKFRESLLDILLRQYETAKIRESQDPVVIQLLSPATAPELRDSPQRKKIVVLATLLGAFLGIFAAFIRHFMNLSAADPEVAPKVNFVKDALWADFIKIKGKILRK
jgi:uncharacterized protein involved in exopolysaccharide biosynthesis